jgi:hypothetical protein
MVIINPSVITTSNRRCITLTDGKNVTLVYSPKYPTVWTSTRRLYFHGRVLCVAADGAYMPFGYVHKMTDGRSVTVGYSHKYMTGMFNNRRFDSR